MAKRSSALERATAAISRQSAPSGRKSVADSEISDDAAELTRFLSGLSQPSKGGKTSNAVPAGLSDISISSDDDLMPPATASVRSPLASAGSKFMKSSKTSGATQSKQLPVKSVSSNPASLNQSPAMRRLSEQTQRFLNKSKGGAAGRAAPSPLYKSEDSTGMSEASESVGGGGNKFLKTKQTTSDGKLKKLSRKSPAPSTHSLRTSTEDDSDMAAYMQKLSPSASEVSDHEEFGTMASHPQPITSQAQAITSKPKNSRSTDYESSFATETFSAESSAAVVSSPEEIKTESEGRGGPPAVIDIAELSVNPDGKRRAQGSTKKSHSMDKDSKRSRSMDNDSKKTLPGAFSSLGLMSVDDLMATQDSSIHTASLSDATKSIPTESSIKSHQASGETISRSSDSSIHTYKASVVTDSVISEIRTRTPTRTDVYDSDFDDTLKETESIATDEDSGSYRARSGQRRSYSTSYRSSRSFSRTPSESPTYSYSSEQLSNASQGRSRSRATSQSSRSKSYSRPSSGGRSDGRSDSKSRSNSQSRSTTGSHAISDNRARSYSRSKLEARDSSPSTVSGNYSSSFEDAVESEQEVREKVRSADAGVQTGVDLDEMILKYYWMTDRALPSVSANQQTKETLSGTPRIANMAVNNEALEVLTTYNPALLALNDMMRGQLELSRQFLDMQKDMQKSVMDSIEREHVYMTLEDTNKFIESHRKPRLTFEQAVSMVREEMNMAS